MELMFCADFALSLHIRAIKTEHVNELGLAAQYQIPHDLDQVGGGVKVPLLQEQSEYDFAVVCDVAHGVSEVVAHNSFIYG
jgi:hypothetical protein